MTSGYSIQRLLQDDSTKSESVDKKSDKQKSVEDEKREPIFPFAPNAAALAMMFQERFLEQREFV